MNERALFPGIFLCVLIGTFAFSGVAHAQTDSVKAHIDSGNAAYAAKDYKLAIKEFKKAESLDKALAEPYFMLARCYFMEAKGGDVLKNLQEAIKRRPDYADAHFLLAKYYYYTNDNAHAKEQLVTALQQGATGAGVHELTGDLRLIEGDSQVALIEYQAALKMASPDDPGAALLHEKTEALTKYVAFINAHGGGPVQLPVPLNHPRPNYTDAGREHHVHGVVRERVLVDQEGKVKNIIMISRLGYGLDEEAIEATKKVKFRPASIGGAPLAYWVTLEVEFNLR